jgi:hypothetical protein
LRLEKAKEIEKRRVREIIEYGRDRRERSEKKEEREK